ncbi:TPA: methylase [bacterium]|nr:methylase [bacterium]
MEFINSLKEFLTKDEIDKLIRAFNQKEKKGLRVNLHKTTQIEIKKSFPNLKSHPFIDYAFIYDEDEYKPGSHPYHLAGLYYIQEPSAMMVTHLLDIKENDKVIDLCAAPGGKSTHALTLLNEDGFLLSNDINYTRALELSKNIEKWGCKNVLVTSTEVSTLASNLSGYFDKVILDAPCSGEGMFRKNKLVYEDWSLEKVKRLSTLQKELILDAYKLLKKDGIMVYSTCTFEKRENEDVINHLLKNTNASLIPIPEHPSFSRGINLKEAIRLYPFKFEGEGHFICLIKCNDDYGPIKPLKKTNKINHNLILPYLEFEKENLKVKLKGNFKLINNDLYLATSTFLPPTNFKILRDGLHLGEIRNKRFIPSHTLALTLKVDEVNQVLNLDYPSTLASNYLQGLTIPCTYQKGYVLVTINGYNIGWGKASKGILKNHFPKGLRLS